MLILTRRCDEAIIIDGVIEVRLLNVKGNQARIGITAPDNISIHREEIQDKIDAEQELKEASGG